MREARIAVGDAQLELGRSSDFPIDWKAFIEIFAGEPYFVRVRGEQLPRARARSPARRPSLAHPRRRVGSDKRERHASPRSNLLGTLSSAGGQTGGRAARHDRDTRTGTVRASPGRHADDRQDRRGGRRVRHSHPARRLSRIDLLMVEWHARTAPCTAPQLAQAPPSSSTRRSVCTELSNSTSEATSSM